MTGAARARATRPAAAGAGRPLDAEVLGELGSRFGHDFGDVRIHDDARAHARAAGLGATAFTEGRDISFARGQFAPDTLPGRRLLAHELGHVVQQSRGGAAPEPDAPDPALEQGADAAATQAVAGAGPVGVAGASGVGVACQMPPGAAPKDPFLKVLTPGELAKLRAFGPADFDESLRALREISEKTGGVARSGSTQQYQDIRQSSGELRTFFDTIADPQVTAVKVVPHPTEGRAPDLYCVRNGRGARVEVVNVTLTSAERYPDLRKTPQGDRPRVWRETTVDPSGVKQETLDLPTTKSLRYSEIRKALSDKITPKASSSGSGVTTTQFDAQNVHTRAGGKPMAVGGTLSLNVHGSGRVEEAELLRVVRSLSAKLQASTVDRIVIHAVDEASGEWRVFEFQVAGPGSVLDPGGGGPAVRRSHLQSRPGPARAGATPTDEPPSKAATGAGEGGDGAPGVRDRGTRPPRAASPLRPGAGEDLEVPRGAGNPGRPAQGAGAKRPLARTADAPRVDPPGPRPATPRKPAPPTGAGAPPLPERPAGATGNAGNARKPAAPQLGETPVAGAAGPRKPPAPAVGETPGQAPPGAGAARRAPPRVPQSRPIELDVAPAPAAGLAGAGLEIMSGLANIANQRSAEEGRRAAAREAATVARMQKDDPEKGVLMVIVFTETNPDSPALNIATQNMISRPFLGVELYQDYTREGAEHTYHGMAKFVPGTNVVRPQFVWYPPLKQRAATEFEKLGKEGVEKMLADMKIGLARHRANFKAEMEGWRYGFWAGVYPPFKLKPDLINDAEAHMTSAAIAIQQGRHEDAYKSLQAALVKFAQFRATLRAWQEGQAEP